MSRRWGPLLLFLAIFGGGCSSKNSCPPLDVDTTQSCAVTADCVSAGYGALSCVNGTCKRTCTSDQECSTMELDIGSTEGCKKMHAAAKVPLFICEAELCTKGCPDNPCASFETCKDGRCVIATEGFEGMPTADLPVVTLASIGWDDIPRQKTNDRTKILFAGRGGCQLGDDNCAGPAAEGTHFLSLAVTPTPPIGTANNGSTCRACACCLECRLNPPSSPPDISSCPTGNAPTDYVCMDPIPQVCASICSQCDTRCTPQDLMVGQGLLACEQEAAAKTCSSCAAYDRCLRDQQSMRGDCQATTDPCHQFAGDKVMCHACIDMACDPQRPACQACRDSATCQLNDPGSAACIQATSMCTSQGIDGCYSTPIDRPRTALNDDEQAATSKAVPLDATMGHLVLQFQYVPFDVLDTYVRVIQGTPRLSWPRDPQEVVVQLCASACDQSGSWTEAKLVDGSRASIPPASQRANGVTIGGQTAIDWSSGRAVVDIPDSFRTKDFRYRFLPKLDQASRVGIDAVVIRRQP